MTILVTGGTGYIGSHTTLLLLQAGFDVVVLDNLCNSSPISLQRVAKLAGKAATFVHGDVRDRSALDRVFSQHSVSAVLHFAGLKSVAESARSPLEYYDTNVGGTMHLCQAMAAAQVHQLVFSSSATVYGTPKSLPMTEDMPSGEPNSPYGRSKLMAENVLRDLATSDPRWSIALLRYFNPAGAHESGLIGEAPQGIPNNLLPYITQVALGKLKTLSIFGDDYQTKDGTGVRDYIHVMDLATGHLNALKALNKKSGINIWNLGTGQGYSVLEILHTFERISQKSVPYQIEPRRLGDIGAYWADAKKAHRELEWQAERGLDEMIRDAWRWQLHHPNGFI